MLTASNWSVPSSPAILLLIVSISWWSFLIIGALLARLRGRPPMGQGGTRHGGGPPEAPPADDAVAAASRGRADLAEPAARGGNGFGDEQTITLAVTGHCGETGRRRTAATMTTEEASPWRHPRKLGSTPRDRGPGRRIRFTFPGRRPDIGRRCTPSPSGVASPSSPATTGCCSRPCRWPTSTGSPIAQRGHRR